MPSQAMQDLIDALGERRKAGAGQPPSALEEPRAAFASPGAAFIRYPTTCW